jgi:sulfate adenylyltransferase subunit 2
VRPSRPALLGRQGLARALAARREGVSSGPLPVPAAARRHRPQLPEVIAFRDRRAAELGERLVVRRVEDSIAAGRVVLRRADESRNPHQSS